MASHRTSDETNDWELVSSDNAQNRTGIKKLSVVIGLFDQPSSLTAALEALISRGFTAADLCVSGTVKTVTMAASIVQSKTTIDPAIVALFVNTEPYHVAKGSPTIVGSHGNLFSMLNGLMGQCKETTYSDSSDGCSKVSSNLIAHIERGRLVLTILTEEPQQLIGAAKVLLRHSPYAVQTHEFLRVWSD